MASTTTSSSISTKKEKKAKADEISEQEVPKSSFFQETLAETGKRSKEKGKRADTFIKSTTTLSVSEDFGSSSYLRGDIDMVPIFAKWNKLPAEISHLVELLRTTELPEICDEKEKDGMDTLKQSLIEESKNIEIVKKDNFFYEEVTEEEREIIAQRVALQQRQFAAYERREHVRKSKRIRKMFDYVCDEEILELLKDCNEDEDEVIYRLTKPNYLSDIRKTISLKYAEEEESYAPLMTDEQRVAYEQLLKKRSVTLRKTTNDQAKKQYRMCGRLGLDEALEQIQNNQVDPEKAFEGWSQARIKAYQMIDQNPNSYYYRFNAPGEVQRKGQWDEPEKKIFFDRLAEVGANGQWGIFSMTIPGRVGYQCSNFYRLLVETKTVSDPNYVLDERGKAHYLFDKKSANGETTKAFRTHSKHSSGFVDILDEPSSSTTAAINSTAPPSTSDATTSTPRNRVRKTPTATTAESKKRKKENIPVPEEGSSPTTTEAAAESSSKKVGGRRQSAASTKAGTNKRLRRARYSGSDSDEHEELYDDDFSGSYSTRAGRRGRGGETNTAVVDVEDESSGVQRKSKRARRPTAAAIESGLVIGGGVNSWHNEEDEEVDPLCPLPGFIDPITLEQIIKPAISKYGHVMGYDSWIRCLNNWEGKRNICPLTKNPLTKRDLVVLTFENLDEYKDKIVNM